MPDTTWLLTLGGTVLLGITVLWFALRRVLRGAYGSDGDRPEPPEANGANDRTPPGD